MTLRGCNHDSNVNKKCKPATVSKQPRRQSVEDKVEELSSTVREMRELMREKGILEEFQHKQKNKSGNNRKDESLTSTSETTIYQEAVHQEQLNSSTADTVVMDTTEVVVDPEITFKGKRISSSSDEPIDTSDELIDDVDNFIADCARQSSERRRSYQDEAAMGVEEVRRQTISQGDRLLHQSEEGKARMIATPGNIHPANLVDENYVVIGGNLDESIWAKIIKQEYVDFARLLPKDRVTYCEDNRMELVCRGGQPSLYP